MIGLLTYVAITMFFEHPLFPLDLGTEGQAWLLIGSFGQRFLSPDIIHE